MSALLYVRLQYPYMGYCVKSTVMGFHSRLHFAGRGDQNREFINMHIANEKE